MFFKMLGECICYLVGFLKKIIYRWMVIYVYMRWIKDIGVCVEMDICNLFDLSNI